MRTSGSIGGAGPATLAKFGTPTGLVFEPWVLPQGWLEGWQVPQWQPSGEMAYGARTNVARLNDSPASVFDRFSTARSTPTSTFYVSTTGSDTTGTGTLALPYRTISKAILAANATGEPAKIMIKGGSYPRFASPGYAGTVPTVDIAFLAFEGRVITGSWDETGTVPADSVHTNTYAITNGGVDRVLDRTRLDDDGFFPEYMRVASASRCNRIPGSWAYEGGKVYIHRHDGAQVTTANTYMLRPRAAVWSFSNPVNIYLGAADQASGFDTLGGSNGAGFVYEVTTLPAAMKAVVVERATFRYNGGADTVPSGADGVRMQGLHGLALFSDCDSSNNTRDGFSIANSLAGARGHMVTVNCRALRNGDRRNGYNTSQSDNAYTLHADTVGCDLAGDFRETGGGAIRNVGTSRGLMIGTRISNDYGDRLVGGIVDPGGVVADENAHIWLDRVELAMSPSTAPIRVAAGAEVRTRRMPDGRSPAAVEGILGSYSS